MDDIPEDVRRFLLEHVESYEELQTVLILHSLPDRRFSAEAAAAAARISVSAAEAALQTLERHGLVLFPELDMSLLRTSVALLSLVVLLFGLVWESRG